MFVLIAVILIVALGYWLISPFFIDVSVNEAFPSEVAEEVTVSEVGGETPSRNNLVGGWLIVSSETLSWDSIILNEDGSYFSHLNERPFDNGTWNFSEGILELKSDGGIEMNLQFSDLILRERKLELTRDGSKSIWNKVE